MSLVNTVQNWWKKYGDPIQAKLSIPPQYVQPILAAAFVYKVPPLDNRGGGWALGRFWFGRVANEKLFYNGVIFFRFMLPFYVGIGFRWSGKDPSKREFLQTYIGWKLNGFFSAAFRVQSDVSAAEGFTAPNPNQAQGWFDGQK